MKLLNRGLALAVVGAGLAAPSHASERRQHRPHRPTQRRRSHGRPGQRRGRRLATRRRPTRSASSASRATETCSRPSTATPLDAARGQGRRLPRPVRRQLRRATRRAPRADVRRPPSSAGPSPTPRATRVSPVFGSMLRAQRRPAGRPDLGQRLRRPRPVAVRRPARQRGRRPPSAPSAWSAGPAAGHDGERRPHRHRGRVDPRPGGLPHGLDPGRGRRRPCWPGSVEVSNDDNDPRRRLPRRQHRQAAQPLLDGARRPRPRALRGDRHPQHPAITWCGRRATRSRAPSTRTSRTRSTRHRRVLLVLQERLRPRLLRRRGRHDDHGQQRPADQLPQRQLERRHHQLLQRRHLRRRRRPRVGPRLHRVHLRPDLPVPVRCPQRVLLRRLGRDRRPDQRHARTRARATSPPSAPTALCSSTAPARRRHDASTAPPASAGPCVAGGGLRSPSRSPTTGVTADVVVAHRRRRRRPARPPPTAARRSPTPPPSPASGPTSTAAPAPSPPRSPNAEAAGATGIVVGNNDSAARPASMPVTPTHLRR